MTKMTITAALIVVVAIIGYAGGLLILCGFEYIADLPFGWE